MQPLPDLAGVLTGRAESHLVVCRTHRLQQVTSPRQQVLRGHLCESCLIGVMLALHQLQHLRCKIDPSRQQQRQRPAA